MKQYKTTIISLIIIAVVIAGFFIVSAVLERNKSSENPADGTAEEAKTETVFDIGSVGELSRYECNIVDDIKLERDSADKWICTTYADLTLNESGILSGLNSVKQCVASVVYEGDITDEIIKNYEISQTQHIKVQKKDGTEYTLRFGMKKPGTASYFAVVEQKNKIYLINSTYKTSITITKENLLHTKIFDFNDTGKIKNVEVLKSGERFFALSAVPNGESRDWTMEYPLNRPGNESHIEEVISAVTSLYTEDYIEGDCEDLSQYGLDNPAYVLRLTDNKGTQTLQLGNKVPEGGAYYCLFGGTNNVFTVSTTTLTFIDDPVLKYMNASIFNRTYTVLESIKIDITCGEINESYTMGFDIWDDGEQLYFNGTALPDDNTVIRAFRRMNTALYSLDLVGLAPEPETKGERLIAVEYHTNDGETILVEGFRVGETTMSLYENGQYCGGYEYIRQITGTNENYGIAGTLENFRTISGMN